jgi:hypothetical protein
MFQQMLARLGMIALAAGFMSACDSDSQSPLAPEERPNFAATARSGPVTAQSGWSSVLLRSKPLTKLHTVTAVIGAEGGSFAIPAAGLSVVVPAGAVSAPTRFRATAFPGPLVAYVFGPHGATFKEPLKVSQDLREINWNSLSPDRTLEGGYFRLASQLDHLRKQAYVNEFFPIKLDRRGAQLEFDIHHFSGYLVSSGRAQ